MTCGFSCGLLTLRSVERLRQNINFLGKKSSQIASGQKTIFQERFIDVVPKQKLSTTFFISSSTKTSFLPPLEPDRRDPRVGPGEAGNAVLLRDAPGHGTGHQQGQSGQAECQPQHRGYEEVLCRSDKFVVL